MASQKTNKYLAEGGKYLFPPTDIDLRKQYKALAIPEFKDISYDEMLYVWYYANRTSPYFYATPENDKVSLCLTAAFGLRKNEVENDYLQGRISPLVQTAIDKMMQFEPSLRFAIHNANVHVMDKYQQLLDTAAKLIDAPDMELKNGKEYVDMTLKILEGMPTIRDTIESNGVRVYTKQSAASDGLYEAAFAESFKQGDN